jgi:Rnl2 family RNA ligase
MSMFNGLKKTYPNITSVSVFGEMFGGLYPHPDVARVNNVSLIQKGVYYSPIHEFYGFDIYVFDGDDGRYLDVEEANALFERYGFFYARRLFQGSLKECLEYPNAFNSNIPEWLGLPPIEGNICEGVVIRPITPMYFRNGSRVLIKNKNEKFAEKKSVKKNAPSTPVELSDALKALFPVADQYVNENRLANVVSHIGEVEFPKDFGKVMGALTKDAIEDFLKEHKDAYMALEKAEQKQVNKRMSSMSADVVKKVYMSQAYII